MEISLNPFQVASLEERFRQNLPSSYLNPSRESASFISEDRFRDLCLALDFLESSGCKGWTAVATLLGNLSPAAVHMAKRQKDRSPSAILLDAFFQVKFDESKEVVETLKILSNVCAELDSYEAKLIVDEELEERRNEVNEASASKEIQEFQMRHPQRQTQVIRDMSDYNMTQNRQHLENHNSSSYIKPFTKGDGYHPLVNLKTKPQDKSNWYHSTDMSLFPYILKISITIQRMTSQ